MLVYITTFQLFCSDCCPSNRRSSYIKQNIILVNLGCFVFLVNIIVNMSNVIQHQKSHPYILTPNKIMSYRSINSITSLRSRTTTYFCRQCAQLTLLPLPGELRESDRRAQKARLSLIVQMSGGFRATFSPHNDSIGCHVTLFGNEITLKRRWIIHAYHNGGISLR